MTDNYRLDLALRKNKGKSRRNEIKAEAGRSFDLPEDDIVFCDLEATGSLQAFLRENRKKDDCFYKEFSEAQIDGLKNILEILQGVNEHPQLLLSYKNGLQIYCGFIKIDGKTVLKGAIDFVRNTQSALYAESEDGTTGFSLEADNDQHYEEGNNTWRLESWGVYGKALAGGKP